MGRGKGSGRGRPLGSKNKNPYPLKERPWMRGENNPKWNDNPGYNVVHRRHYRYVLGPCSHQDDTCSGKIEIAIKHDTPDDRILRDSDGPWAGFPFSLDPGDYMRLCVHHHRLYDWEPGWSSRTIKKENHAIRV